MTEDVRQEDVALMQDLLDRYSEGGGIVNLLDDSRAFLAIVNKHASPLRDRIAVLEGALNDVRRLIIEGIEPRVRDWNLGRALEKIDAILNGEKKDG